MRYLSGTSARESFMGRAVAAILGVLALAACTTGEPTPEAGREPNRLPAPPPMPQAEIAPGGEPADLRTAHASACTIAVFSEVPRQIAGVERVQADDASLTAFPAEGDRVRVTGAGRYYRGGDNWRPFTFECIYDQADARITEFVVRTA
jgi:hypothetical protein